MKKLWTSFEVIAHHVLKTGGRVAIEWPANCAYWHDKRVRAFVKVHQLDKARCRGCAVGVVDDAVTPMPKPWHIATSDSFLFEALSCPCPGSDVHPIHATVQGKYTKGTENYTDTMVKLIHEGWRRSCEHAAMCMDSSRRPARGTPPAAPATAIPFTSSCPPMVVPKGTLFCSHQEVCVAAARETVASAKDTVVSSIEVVSKGGILPSTTSLWTRRALA